MAEKKIIGDYARLILSDWPSLVKKMTGTEQSTVSPEEIEAALGGPLGEFFRKKIQAYANVMEEAHKLALHSEEAFKALVQAASTQSTSEINEALSDLKEKTEGDYRACLDLWQEGATILVQALALKKVELSPSEIEDLSRQEALQYVYKRYQELNLELPKLKSQIMTLENYLYLKTYLAVQSYLSRQHLPHEAANILSLLKSLKKDFQKIAENEKALYKKQELEK